MQMNENYVPLLSCDNMSFLYLGQLTCLWRLIISHAAPRCAALCGLPQAVPAQTSGPPHNARARPIHSLNTLGFISELASFYPFQLDGV